MRKPKSSSPLYAFLLSLNCVPNFTAMPKHLQRKEDGRRQVVGCIPYRYKNTTEASLQEVSKLEVLIISSTKGKGWLFPKGHWKIDETKKEGASREALEEAGVRGTLEPELGKWEFSSKAKARNTLHDAYMFPLLVQEELDEWPEKNIRQRIWMTATEARVVCQRLWMKEALDKLLDRLASHQRNAQNQSQHHPIDIDLGNENTLPRPTPRSLESLAGMERMKWTLVLTSLLIEGLSSAFDQMSSPEKPQYALMAMLMAFVGLLIFFIEVCFTMQEENVSWRRSGRIWCFYYPPPNDRVFGTTVDSFGLACAIWQCVYSVIEYVHANNKLDNPIKMAVIPFIFMFCVAISRLSRQWAGVSPHAE